MCFKRLKTRVPRISGFGVFGLIEVEAFRPTRSLCKEKRCAGPLI